MVNELRKELFRLLSTLSMEVYFVKAKLSASFIYCVFSLINNSANRDSVNKFEKCNIQISLYGNNLSEIEAKAEQVYDLLDDGEKEFVFNNFAIISIRRINDRLLENEDVWHKVIEYEIDLQRV